MPGNITHANINTGDILTANKYNGDFINIINGMTPDGIDDYAANASQFLSGTDPGEPGSEVLPTSMSGEIRTLRYRIGEITGLPWIQTLTTKILHPHFEFSAAGRIWNDAANDVATFLFSVPADYFVSTTNPFFLNMVVATLGGTGNVRFSTSVAHYRNTFAGFNVLVGALSTLTVANANATVHTISTTGTDWQFGDVVVAQVTRLGNDALDTMAAQLQFYGINVSFTGWAGR